MYSRYASRRQSIVLPPPQISHPGELRRPRARPPPRPHTRFPSHLHGVHHHTQRAPATTPPPPFPVLRSLCTRQKQCVLICIGSAVPGSTRALRRLTHTSHARPASRGRANEVRMFARCPPPLPRTAPLPEFIALSRQDRASTAASFRI
ncbi:hypothetical protein PHLGIDRAFT_449800 [Phlebiopsis gigantea 11061_1 CR5-6]|uniref:Uncharacterized protein n=1 Tax=Phlebiopsis gigantea (strain 11061_1 CR5-6) TaxID=745531 RepID=A0A0C3RXK8_PHLG1|nr:hypothetical protein PHLGIDRAFT_449800 [Phlebiopsis gigantea 11061_1 CR5-6]